MKREKMLVIRLSALGDVAMTIPVVYALATAYPQLDIYYLTRPFFARLFINPPVNLHIISPTANELSGFGGLLRLARRLRDMRFDYVADLHNMLRSRLLSRILKPTGRGAALFNKHRSLRHSFLRHRRQQMPSVIEEYKDVFRKLGFTVASLPQPTLSALPTPPMAVPPGAVGIAPFARYYNKTYPLSHVARLVDALTAEGRTVLLFGARGGEAKTLEGLAEGRNGAISVAGKYSIEEELALMSQLAAMVSMDSANGHLAALTGCPVVSVWGSTTPACGFTPYDQPASRQAVLGCKCQPCSIAGGPNCPLGTLECLEGLPPAAIVEIVNSIDPRNGSL